MRKSIFFKTSFTFFLNPLKYLSKREYVFLVSHMRSYSTLLCHILGSNPDIAGYAEMHQNYLSILDFLKLKLKLKVRLEENNMDIYVLDKILHNHYSISQNILKKNNVHVIFLIRNPMDTITSIMNMGQNKTYINWFNDFDKVINYYVNRMRKIYDIALLPINDAVYIDSEDLINNSDRILKELTNWLNLKTPLNKNYSIFKYTGRPVFGDSSVNILKGEILNSKRTSLKEITQYQKKEINQAYNIYQYYRRIIKMKYDLKK